MLNDGITASNAARACEPQRLGILGRLTTHMQHAQAARVGSAQHPLGPGGLQGIQT